MALMYISLMIRDGEHFFLSTGHAYVLFREVSIQVLCPLFTWIVCLGVERYRLFIYFGNHSLIRCVIGEYVLPFSRLLFHFADGFFGCEETF